MTERSKKKRKTNKQKSGSRYHCDACKKDISSEIRIKCQECNDFDLCVCCFYEGVEVREHKPYHSYSVINDMSIPLFTENWSGEEEILLLEGVEMFGLGNWPAISEHVGDKKAKHECEYHYWKTYIDVPTFPLPDIESHLKKKEIVTESMVKKDDKGMCYEILKQTGQDPYDIPQKGKFDHVKKGKDGEKLGAEVGYLPLRRGFLTEHTDNAEQYIADMEINHDDPEDVRSLKLEMLRQYDYKISERRKRTKFLITRNFYDYKRQRSEHKKRKRPDKELYNKYKKFSRFLPQNEFEKFLQGLFNQTRIRNEINLLKHYREMGICTLSQGKKYEYEKRKRDPNFKAKRGSSRFIEEMEEESNDMLSNEEYRMINSLSITIKQYLLVKDFMTKESFRLGFISKNSAKNSLKMSNNIISKLYDFFLYCGWIRNSKPQPLGQVRTPRGNAVHRNIPVAGGNNARGNNARGNNTGGNNARGNNARGNTGGNNARGNNARGNTGGNNARGNDLAPTSIPPPVQRRSSRNSSRK